MTNLTIQDNETVVQYESTGQSVFAYTFPILAAAEIRVSLNQVLLTYGTDFTVDGIGDAGGGDFTILAGTDSGDIVTAWQDMPIERLTGFSAGAAVLLPEALNAEFAARLRVEQQLRREIRNSLRLAPDDPVGDQDMVLPTTTRVLRFLSFDAQGRPVYSLGTGTDTGLRDDLAEDTGASLIGTANGQTVEEALGNGVPAGQQRGVFTLPATISFFGDSFWEQPNAHTAGDSMAQKAAVLLGATPLIDATSGNTSADKQDAIFDANPAATDAWFIGLGQNDAQFAGTGTDRERRLNDMALIHLANHFQMGVPAGGRRYLASTFTQSGGSAWTADADIAEGGALKSNTITDTLAVEVLDSRFVVVIYKIKTANGGKFSVVIDGSTRTCPTDTTGYHNAPLGNIPTNTGKTFARCALVFDLGRRKPRTTVQFVVSSATGAGNVVTICSVMGLSGDPLAGPLLVGCDLTDRGAAGYATAAGSQFSVQIVSRMINQSLAVAGGCGLRVVPVALSTVIDPNTHLDVDEFHPSESGAVAGAQAIATAVQNAARDWTLTRRDLDAQSLVNGADGYVLLGGAPLFMGPDWLWKRRRLSGRHLELTATEPILCPDSIRILFDDGSGAYDLTHALYLARETGNGGDALAGNLGAGPFALVAYGAVRMRITTSGAGIANLTAAYALTAQTASTVQLGSVAVPFDIAFLNFLRCTTYTTATLPAPSASLQGARTFVNDSNATLAAGLGNVLVGGGGNFTPVYCDGTNWRIG